MRLGMLVVLGVVLMTGCEHDGGGLEQREIDRNAWRLRIDAEVCNHLPADGGGLLPYGCEDECERKWARVRADIAGKKQFEGVAAYGWMRECVYHCCERMPAECRSSCSQWDR